MNYTYRFFFSYIILFYIITLYTGFEKILNIRKPKIIHKQKNRQFDKLLDYLLDITS